MTTQQVEQAALSLPEQARLHLAWSLLNSLVKQNGNHTEVAETNIDNDAPPQNALMEWAGIYSGKSSDTARRAKEILLEEVDPVYGLGIR